MMNGDEETNMPQKFEIPVWARRVTRTLDRASLDLVADGRSVIESLICVCQV